MTSSRRTSCRVRQWSTGAGLAAAVEEFGSGYGNVLEESMNAAGTSDTVGDFLLAPFGDENITPIVDFLLNYTGTPLTDAVAAVAPSSFADLLSSIGL
jgi:hypothetical protein